MSNLTFDGHDFAQLGVYGDPEYTLLDSQPQYADAQNRNGSIVLGKTLGNGAISFSLGINGTAHERRVKLSMLGNWLDVDEPKQLVLPDAPDWYYLAIPEGSIESTRGIGGEIVRMTFALTDPIAYGEENSVIIPRGGSATFIVGGTAPTYPYMKSDTTIKPDTSTLLWGLRFDNQDTWSIGADTSARFKVWFDMGRRESRLYGTTAKLPTLDSDWFELTPGVHTIENYLGSDIDGSSITLYWRERWF